jgi:hypothetical protein
VLLLALAEIGLRNYRDLIERHIPGTLQPASYAVLFIIAVVCGNRISEFIYFQF